MSCRQMRMQNTFPETVLVGMTRRRNMLSRMPYFGGVDIKKMEELAAIVVMAVAVAVGLVGCPGKFHQQQDQTTIDPWNFGVLVALPRCSMTFESTPVDLTPTPRKVTVGAESG